jgi:NAD(P)-dependent dehydrogenase (short-subunit alcohol dehydrogenase family)
LVTGAASGIGAAIVTLLESSGCEVLALDLRDGFDVRDPGAWERVGAVELACLNAGVTTREHDIRSVSDHAYRRIVGANVDGVVFGVRRLAAIQEPGSAIVITASLAGLVAAPQDPLYTLTKHAVVGFVRSVAPQLAERGIRINAVAPGFVDTPLLGDEARARFVAAGFPLLQPEEVGHAILTAARSDDTGRIWVVQPGREPVQFRFANVPGPRDPSGAVVGVPPLGTA